MSARSKRLPPEDRERDEQLELLIAEYIRDAEEGRARDRQELLARNPKFADELTQLFAQRDRLNRLVDPIREFGGDLQRAVGPDMRLSYVGDYELLEEIARGGMGVVFKARQSSLGRIVAVKMIVAGTLANDQDVQRFRSEAQAAAKLKHPNIVAIHEVGQHEGWHYFSMDFVAGCDLAEILQLKLLPAETAATYVCQMAEAIHFAHQQGILHRDLKPSNVLIDQNNQVHITDFGLATRVDGSEGLTQTGQIVGTPSYMPPEQAQCMRESIGPASDVYALGAILYECLTGRPPFRAESVIMTLRQVVDAEAAPPRTLNAVIPRDLETICLKCLEKEPQRRYTTAQALAEDLQRFLAGRPVEARPISRSARAARWCRRNPVTASLLTLVALSLILGTTVSSYFAVMQARQFNQLKSEQQQTSALRLNVNELKQLGREMEESLALGQEHLNLGETRLFETYFQLARNAWRNDNLELANYYLNQCPDRHRDRAWDDLKQRCYPNVLTLDGHTHFAISRDGKRLAAPSKATISIWDLESKQKIQSIPLDSESDVALAFTSDADSLAYGQQRLLHIWDIRQAKRTTTLTGHEFGITDIDTCRASSMLATASIEKLPKKPWYTGDVILWNLGNVQQVAKVPGMKHVSLSRDGQWMATGGKGVTVWKTNDLSTPHLTIDTPTNGPPCFHPRTNELAIASGVSIEFWDVVEREMVKHFIGDIRADLIAYSPDGKRLAYSGETAGFADRPHVYRAHTWNTITREKERTIPWFNREISDLSFTPDGRFLVTADSESVRLWDVSPPPDPTNVILNDIADMDVGSHDWPQWGGSKSRINSPAGKNIPTHWSIGDGLVREDRYTVESQSERKRGSKPLGSKNVKWAMPLGSETYGNPVVANGKIFLGTNNGAGYLERYPPEVDLGVLLCFDEATGDFLWQHSNEKLKTGRIHDWPNQGVCSTPVVDGDRLWYVSNRGEIVCLDTEGFYDDQDDGVQQEEWTDLFRIDALLHGQLRPSGYLKSDKLPTKLLDGFRQQGEILPQFLSISASDDQTIWDFAESTYSDRQYVVGPRLYRIRVSGDELIVSRISNDNSKVAFHELFRVSNHLLPDIGNENVVWSLRDALHARGIHLNDDPQPTTLQAGVLWSFTGLVDGREQPFRLQLTGPTLVVQFTEPWKETADVVWTLNMMTELGVSQHNMANCSMLTANGLLYVCTSNGVDESHQRLPAPIAPSFLAVDRNSGKVVWTDNSPGENVMHAQWGSPSYGVFNGQAQVIFAGGDGWLYSFDPVGDGRGGSRLLWKFDGNPKTAVYSLGGGGTKNQIIAFPAIYDGLLYVVMGEDPEHGEGDGHLWCIDPSKRLDGSDVSAELAVDAKGKLLPQRRLQAVDIRRGETAVPNPKSAVVWHYSHADQDGDGEYSFTECFHRSLSTPVIKDDVLYIADFSGIFHCLNAKTGKVYWTYDLFAACWSSALVVDGNVYIADEDGDVAVFRHSADPRIAMKAVETNEGRTEFIPYYATYEGELVNECKMDSAIYMTPIVANDVLYIATRNTLYAIADSNDKEQAQ